MELAVAKCKFHHGRVLFAVLVYVFTVNAILATRTEPGNTKCAPRKFESYLKSIDGEEDLNEGVVVRFNLRDPKEMKRFLLHIDSPKPLNITIIAKQSNVSSRLYFNQTNILSHIVSPKSSQIIIPCALAGPYDLIVQSNVSAIVAVESSYYNSFNEWSLLKRVEPVKIRTEVRVPREMVVKWSRSKLDFHIVQYCVVVNPNRPIKNFCQAVGDYLKGYCISGSAMDFIWSKRPTKVRVIDPHRTNVICTRNKTQQIIKGLIPNRKYFFDVFGVHTNRGNLAFHLKSKMAWFNRTRNLIENQFGLEKLSQRSNSTVFGFKIPQPNSRHLRYLIVPCNGSVIDVKIFKRHERLPEYKKRKSVFLLSKNIAKPTYINVTRNVHMGERYAARVSPSTEDEIVRASRVGIAVTANEFFDNVPELPSNTQIQWNESTCNSAVISWESSPDTRTITYCVIVFKLPNQNRSPLSTTNYCLDFGPMVTDHPQYYYNSCTKRKNGSSGREVITLSNLEPEESYLVYVTIKLDAGKALPYESVKIKINKQHCSEPNYFD